MAETIAYCRPVASDVLMRDPVETAAVMDYRLIRDRPGTMPLSAFFAAAQSSFAPVLTFPDVPSLSEPLSGQAAPDDGLQAALLRQHQPVLPRWLESPQPEDGLDDDPNVTLDSQNLWSEFHKSGTEMVITKSGRYVN